MNIETQKRMEGLINRADHEKIKSGCQGVIRGFKDEGFEDIEIYEFLKRIVRQAGN